MEIWKVESWLTNSMMHPEKKSYDESADALRCFWVSKEYMALAWFRCATAKVLKIILFHLDDKDNIL
jgi:hypothetical protein